MPTLKRLVVAPIVDAPCDSCVQHGTARCPTCGIRRRTAIRLHERDGLSVDDIARRMRLTVPRVRRLLEQEADRRALARFETTRIPTARVRALLDRRRRQNPAFSIADLTRPAGYSSQTQVERLLGLKPTSDTHKNGKTYGGGYADTVEVDHAARLVRALGLRAL